MAYYRNQTTYGRDFNDTGSNRTTGAARQHDTSSHHWEPDSHLQYSEEEGRQRQIQDQQQLRHQRSAEASTQMVYDVYGNVIAILEELEHRELKDKKVHKQLARSEIHLPNQSHKADKDVKRILEAQLLLFQTQLKSCQSDIRERVVHHLQEQTLQWNAERASHQLPVDHLTDRYLGQLFEILALGSSEHPDAFYQSPGDVKGVTPKDMEVAMVAQHKIGEIDRQYEDPTRKARGPKIRSGDVRKGAERIRTTRKDLERYLPRKEEEMNLQ